MGNLTAQTDNRGQTVCSYYDALNRLTGIYYTPLGNPSCQSPPGYQVVYTYDLGTSGVGQRTAAAVSASPGASTGYAGSCSG